MQALVNGICAPRRCLPAMKSARPFLLGIFLAALLPGCASDGRNLQPGTDANAVRAQMGAPKEVIQLADGGEAWFYPGGRITRQT